MGLLQRIEDYSGNWVFHCLPSFKPAKAANGWGKSWSSGCGKGLSQVAWRGIKGMANSNSS